MQIPISAANWIPISATYSYDSNIDLDPTPITWSDGYKAISHPMFSNARSMVINRDTLMVLTSATSFFGVMREPIYGAIIVGSYISLKMGNNYVTNISGTLYLSDSAITDNSFFRLIANANGTFSLMQSNTLYVTVDPYSPYELTMQPQSINTDISRQMFNMYAPNDNLVYLSTTFNNPFSSYGPVSIQRFWSYNAGTSAIQCIGTAADASSPSANPYVFNVNGVGLVDNLDGLTRDQTWVQYYNNTDNTANNKNVEISTSNEITGIHVNRLTQLPYLSKITIDGPVGSMGINIANLKNVLTPEYEYHTIPTEQ